MEINSGAHENVASKGITRAQEPKASMHERVTHTFATVGLTLFDMHLKR